MANGLILDGAKPPKTFYNTGILKKTQIEFFSSQMENRRLEQVYKKLWKTFGLSLLEYEVKNHHDGHLSVLDSDSFLG